MHQLTRNLTEEQIRQAGFDAYFVDHTAGVYPTAASGFPWSAASMQVKGDLIADLTEDLAADAARSQGQHFSSCALEASLSPWNGGGESHEVTEGSKTAPPGATRHSPKGKGFGRRNRTGRDFYPLISAANHRKFAAG